MFIASLKISLKAFDGDSVSDVALFAFFSFIISVNMSEKGRLDIKIVRLLASYKNLIFCFRGNNQTLHSLTRGCRLLTLENV